jgi:hypothetical protein
LRNRN